MVAGEWGPGGTGTPAPPSLGALRGHVDLDLTGLHFLTQRQPNRQHAVLVLGGDFPRVDRLRKRERAGERPVATLDPMELLLLRVGRDLLLALDGEHAVIDR